MRALITIALLIAATCAHAQVKPSPPSLLIPGDYHGDEAPHTLGPGWLALVPMAGGWRLVPAKAKVQRVYDAVLDAEGQATGARITAQTEAIALLRLPALRAGRVKTPDMRFKDVSRPLSAAAPITMAFNGVPYRLGVKGSVVELRQGHASTLLADVAVGGPDGEDTASLLWAGDLDGDERLDLLVSYTGYNKGGVCLFLSSRAAPDALVGRVGCHGGVGC